MAGFVAHISGGDESPGDFVETALLVVRQIVEAIPIKAKGLKRLVEERVGKIGGKRVKAIGTVHGEKGERAERKEGGAAF